MLTVIYQLIALPTLYTFIWLFSYDQHIIIDVFIIWFTTIGMLMVFFKVFPFVYRRMRVQCLHVCILVYSFTEHKNPSANYINYLSFKPIKRTDIQTKPEESGSS